MRFNDKEFLRTGDLGLMVNNELVITGRIKDLIIVRGVNIFPQDLEYTAYTASQHVKQGACVAFAIEEGEEEHVALVFEPNTENPGVNADELFKMIKKKIMEEHQVVVHALYMVKPRSILKTTSGKLQRRSNKQALLNNQFQVIAQMR